MPLTADTIGSLLRDHRLRLRLSQPEAARRAHVSTRLWSETERGERANVSFGTLVNMLAVVGVVLEPAVLEESKASERIQTPLTPDRIEAIREDLRQAAAYGVDLSLIRAGLDRTPLERVQRNDEALAFFSSVTVEPGWKPARPHRRRLDARNRPSAP